MNLFSKVWNKVVDTYKFKKESVSNEIFNVSFIDTNC